MSQTAEELARDGLRVLGIADPIRPEVPRAVAECRSAGIRVVMITGDHPVTASSIAKKIGLENPDQVTTGQLLEQMSDAEVASTVRTVSVF